MANTNVSATKPRSLADLHGDSFIIQREVTLYKLPGEPFGITLAYVHKKAIVVAVNGDDGAYACPATRAGINFGDEIVSLNGMIMSSASTFLQACHILEESKKVKLALREMPFFRLVPITPDPPGADFGFAFKNAITTTVAPDSPAALAGIKVGDALVAVNGEVVVGKADALMRSALRRAWGVSVGSGEAMIVTVMPADIYPELLDAVLQVPVPFRPTIASVHANVVVSPRGPASPTSTAAPTTPRGSIVAPATPEPTARRSWDTAGALSFLRMSSLTGHGDSARQARASVPHISASAPHSPTSTSTALRRQTSAVLLPSRLRRQSSHASVDEAEPGPGPGPGPGPRTLLRSIRGLVSGASNQLARASTNSMPAAGII